MITQRFRPVLWVGGVALAATSLYLISLQVASEHKRLEEVNRKILSTEHDIRQLKTEISTRSNLRQLEKWNGESLALITPRASQYVNNPDALAHFDIAKLTGSANTPSAAMASVTSDAQSVAAQKAAEAAKFARLHPAQQQPAQQIPAQSQSNQQVALSDALSIASGHQPKP
jgi:hypothetical protein